MEGDDEKNFNSSSKISNKRSLFDFVKKVNGESVIDLDDEDVQNYVGDISTFLNLPIEDILSYFYHFKDTTDHIEDFEMNSEMGKERYFGDKRICFKCNQEGHIEQKCPTTNKNCCILCEGIDHFKSNCIQNICNRCGKCGHRAINCKEMKLKSYLLRPCQKCPNPHIEFNCPLIWRYYKFNKLLNKPITMSCSICFGNDHFSDDCNPKTNKTSIFTKKFLKKTCFYKISNDFNNKNRGNRRK